MAEEKRLGLINAELLEALKAMLDSNERILKATGVCVFDKVVKEQAEAAIKKATEASRG